MKLSMPYDYRSIYNPATSTFTKGYLVKYDCPDSSFDKIKTAVDPNASIEFFKKPDSIQEKKGAFRVSHCHPHHPSLNLYSSEEDKTNLAKFLKQYHMCLQNLTIELENTESILLKKILVKEISQDEVTMIFLKNLVNHSTKTC